MRRTPAGHAVRVVVAVSTLLVALTIARSRLEAQNFTISPRTGEMLLTIGGQFSSVQYSPGFLDRANHVLKRLDYVGGDLKKRGKAPLALHVVVIPREPWESAQLPRPYGLPVRLSGSTLVVPAIGDDEMVRLWKRWLGSDLPPIDGTPMRGTVEGASALVLADLILQREIGGLFVDARGLSGSEPWMRSFFAQLVAITEFGHYEPSRMLEIETVYYRLGSQMPLLIELAGDDQPLPIERWLQGEAMHFKAALEIYELEGDKALARALKERRKNGVLTRAKVVELYPSLLPWLTGPVETAAQASPPAAQSPPS